MDSLIDIVEFGANLIDGALAAAFMLILLGKKKKLPVWAAVVITTGFVVANVILQNVFPDSPENIMCYIGIMILYACSCIKGRITQKLLYMTIWNILLMFCGLIYAAVYGFILRGKPGIEWQMTAIQRLQYLLGSKLNLILLTALTLLILKRTKIKSGMLVMNFVVFLISILVGIILDSMLDYQYLDTRGKMAVGIAMIGIFTINIFVYLASYQLDKAQRLQMENQLLRMSQEEQKDSMERMMKQQEKNRILRHDIRHYFTVFQELLAKGKTEDAQRYVQEVLDTDLQAAGIYMTGDEVLDAVLNHCDGICRQKGITFIARVSAHLPKSQMEFAIMLLNLLENAVEAEEKETEKRIELEMYESAGLYLVTIKNRISQSVLETNPEFHTQKSDTSIHGLGRKSVKRLVQDMEGTFYEEEKNGYFISNIVL